MAAITGEEAMYWEDVDDQLANEAQNKLELAHKIAENFKAVSGDKEITWRDTIGYIQSYNANPANPNIMEKTDEIETTTVTKEE